MTAYVSIIQQLQQLCTENNITVSSVITDYESALRNAIAIVMPETPTKGCYFHFAKAVYQKYKVMGLTRRASADRRLAVKKLMCLALLPNDKILEAIQLVRGVYQIYLQNFCLGVCVFVCVLMPNLVTGNLSTSRYPIRGLPANWLFLVFCGFYWLFLVFSKKLSCCLSS